MGKVGGLGVESEFHSKAARVAFQRTDAGQSGGHLLEDGAYDPVRGHAILMKSMEFQRSVRRGAAFALFRAPIYP
jgi:hypothetical protein